jgi:hypothetical protein
MREEGRDAIICGRCGQQTENIVRHWDAEHGGAVRMHRRHAEKKPQCIAMASGTGRQCRLRPERGGDVCAWHRGRAAAGRVRGYASG